jgi:HAD superfamily hydrolase (TIGR01509 family)
MSVRDYDLFIFDWDGTLSTSTFIVRVSNLLRRRYRSRHIMEHKEEYMRRAERNIAITEEGNKLFSILYNIYSSVVMPRLKPGAVEVLKALRKKGKKIAVFSDSQSYRLMLEARNLGIIDHVDFILSASSIGYYKPNPTGLMLIADRYKKTVKRSLYIGDMPSDIMTAKFAGMASCGLGDGLSSYSSLKESGPDYLFRNIQAMLKEISD